MQLLAESFANYARNKPLSDKMFYLLDEKSEYSDSVYRVKESELKCWYRYIFTQNDSEYRFKETIKPQLYGLEVVYPGKSEDG